MLSKPSCNFNFHSLQLILFKVHTSGLLKPQLRNTIFSPNSNSNQIQRGNAKEKDGVGEKQVGNMQSIPEFGYQTNKIIDGFQGKPFSDK